MKKVLALSSSRTGNSGYLEKAVPLIKEFLGNEPQTIAFIPFASIDNYEAYGEKVREGLASLPHQLKIVTAANAKADIESSDAIMVGGGNTFKLLHDLYKLNLVELIKEKVEKGTAYIGWSAGANLCGPTICTTNDMPVIQPESFAAFDFFPFQINPHYYNVVMEGFNGETRDQRLEEFIKLNPDKTILCLPEGTGVCYINSSLNLVGSVEATLMKLSAGRMIAEKLEAGANVSFLLKK